MSCSILSCVDTRACFFVEFAFASSFHARDMTLSYVCYDSFICVSWLIRMCAMICSYVCHDSFMYVSWLLHMCDMTHSYVCYVSFICVTRLIHMCVMTHSHDSFICVLWLIYMCGECIHSHINWSWVFVCLRHSYISRKNSCHTYEWVVSHIRMCHFIRDETHSYVQHYWFNMIDMTDSCVCHDSFICLTSVSTRTSIVIKFAWGIHTCCMTHSHAWHDSFTWVARLIHVCDMTPSFMWHDSFMCERSFSTRGSTVVEFSWGLHTCALILRHTETIMIAATRCNTLQHAAARCNTIQRTATHCNAWQQTLSQGTRNPSFSLQHAATRCNTLRHTLFKAKKKPSCSLPIDASSLLSPSSTHCNSSQHTATHCNTPQHTATHRNTPYSKAHETHPARCLSTLCLCFRPHSPPTRHFPCAPLHWRQTAQFRCSKVRRDSFICVPWLIHIHVCHDSFICVPWLLHMCTPTLTTTAAVPLLLCVTWLIHMCVTTHSFVCRDSSICMHLCATTHACVCDVTHSYVWDE